MNIADVMAAASMECHFDASPGTYGYAAVPAELKRIEELCDAEGATTAPLQ